MLLLTGDRVVSISAALIVYFTKICWFGLCDEENVVETSFSSFVFVFAFALLFSEYDWFPRKIRYRSEIAVFVFKVCLSDYSHKCYYNYVKLIIKLFVFRLWVRKTIRNVRFKIEFIG